MVGPSVVRDRAVVLRRAKLLVKAYPGYRKRELVRVIEAAVVE